jgi:hypothetical protein
MATRLLTDELRAALEEEALRIRLDPEVVDDGLDGREQGLADMPTWKDFAFEDEYANAGLREDDGGRGSTRTGPGDDHIPFLFAWRD